MNSCPCGSGIPYADCCQPVIAGARMAATAEELMRARYTAYARVETDFLFDSTHPGHKQGYDHEGTRKWAEEAEWLGLDILDCRKGGRDDTVGEVEFKARYREKGALREHHEAARFRKEKDVWLFTEGTMVKPKPLVSTKVGRNDPCPCGSGAKFKKCCGK